MLSRPHRLHRSGDFRSTVREGSRAGSRTLVVHVLVGDPAASDTPPQMGLIVNKAVGPAVVRNRVKRRLRHLSRPLLADLPAGALVVLRALPAAATVSSGDLGAELTRCLQRAQKKAQQRALERAQQRGASGGPVATALRNERTVQP